MDFMVVISNHLSRYHEVNFLALLHLLAENKSSASNVEIDTESKGQAPEEEEELEEDLNNEQNDVKEEEKLVPIKVKTTKRSPPSQPKQMIFKAGKTPMMMRKIKVQSKKKDRRDLKKERV